jgi:hypothetical protein
MDGFLASLLAMTFPLHRGMRQPATRRRATESQVFPENPRRSMAGDLALAASRS